MCGAAEVLESPVERLDAAIVVGGPAAVLVAADFLFEPAHKKQSVISLQASDSKGKGECEAVAGRVA